MQITVTLLPEYTLENCPLRQECHPILCEELACGIEDFLLEAQQREWE